MLRRNRVHGTGAASTDFRSPVQKKKLRPVLHEAKYKYHELMLGSHSSKASAAHTSGMSTMADFYTSTGRKINTPQHISRPKTHQLDGFRTFVGGDNEPFLSIAQVRRQSTTSYAESMGEADKARSYASKVLEHKKATHETQLVTTVAGLTLEGEVDFDKVADIRRTLRRRYHTRSNIRGLFNCWDLGSEGVIRPQDVNVMMNRLGIPVNMDEAKVLVASACKSKAGTLGLDEFIDLISEENDKFNVDIAMIDPKLDYNARVSEMSANQHSAKVQRTLRVLLQERYAHISTLLYRADNKKCGILSKDAFFEALFQLGFPPHIAHPNQLQVLYNEFGGDDAGISYKHFCEQLKTIQIRGETLNLQKKDLTNPVIAEFQHKYGPRLAQSAEGPRKLLVLDPRRQPFNKLSEIHKNGTKLKRFLMESFESEEHLAGELRKLSGGQYISQETLADFIRPHISDIYSSQLEHFLSTFIYNSEGRTCVARLAKYIYSDELESVIQMEEKYRAVPLSRKTARSLSPSTAMNLLSQIESRVLQTRSVQGMSLMAMFDKDKDGYVSADDMKQALNRFDITCSAEQAQGLINCLDNDSKGYLTMNDLARSLQLQILEANADKLRLSRYFNTSQPSTEFLQSQLSHTQETNQFYNKTRSELVPKLGTVLTSSRYGASPPYKDTFRNIQADPTTTHYLTEESRLTRKSLDPINLGIEDKAREQRSKTAKEDRKRRVLKSVEISIADRVADEDLRTTGKLYSKALIKQLYQTKLEC